MRLSLGIFAHNEERNIGATLESLFSQTLFDGAAARKLGVEALEVLCLANGCRDRTLEVARSYGLDLPPHVTYRVVDLPEPGKSRTWNAFVHELSAGNATFLVAMDADIIFEQDDVLEQLVRRLLDDPRAQVSTDTPLKALAADPASLSMADRASVAASSQASKEGVLCGQLYCARADILRKIWLPPALPVEDGFLGAMIKTSGFTSPDDWRMISCMGTRSVSAATSTPSRVPLSFILSTSAETAISAIVSMSILTVVSDGVTTGDHMRSSKPVTLTSAGTLMPSCCSSVSARRACRSERAANAVKP